MDEVRHRLTELKNPGDFVQSLGSPGRGAGPAIAGSEGSGFSLEKPPPEAEYEPEYSESLVFAPAAQGLTFGQAGTPQSAALTAPLSVEPLRLYEFARAFSSRQSVPPSSTAEAVPLLQGEGYGLPSGGIRATDCSVRAVFGRLIAAPAWCCFHGLSNYDKF